VSPRAGRRRETAQKSADPGRAAGGAACPPGSADEGRALPAAPVVLARAVPLALVAAPVAVPVLTRVAAALGHLRARSPAMTVTVACVDDAAAQRQREQEGDKRRGDTSHGSLLVHLACRAASAAIARRWPGAVQ